MCSVKEILAVCPYPHTAAHNSQPNTCSITMLRMMSHLLQMAHLCKFSCFFKAILTYISCVQVFIFSEPTFKSSMSQLLSFCLNSDKLSIQAPHTGDRQRIWKTKLNSFKCLQKTCGFIMWIFSSLRTLDSLNFQPGMGLQPCSACSCLQHSTHCCCQGWGPAAELLCVCTSAEHGHVVDLGACAGA